jgi:hypothetical protein
VRQIDHLCSQSGVSDSDASDVDAGVQKDFTFEVNQLDGHYGIAPDNDNTPDNAGLPP